METQTVGSRLIAQRRLGWRVYSALAAKERNNSLRKLLFEFAESENKRYESLKLMFPKAEQQPTLRENIGVATFVFTRSILGIAFTSKLLERGRKVEADSCAETLKRIRDHGTERAALTKFAHEKPPEEAAVGKGVYDYESQIEYIRSIVFGLNDGLVEILAVVAGLAVVATSSSVVVIGAFIVGVSGTLSMAGGAYLSSKSERIFDKASNSIGSRTNPAKDAFYTGVYYFVGALVPIFPFLIGLNGYYGIAVSIIFVCAVLTFASIIIGVIGGSSIKRRVVEMLLISLGAAFATILLGSVLRAYGISI